MKIHRHLVQNWPCVRLSPPGPWMYTHSAPYDSWQGRHEQRLRPGTGCTKLLRRQTQCFFKCLFKVWVVVAEAATFYVVVRGCSDE